MKFVILSHAGLLADHGGTQIVIDPWIIGSCYWRSWWNFPEPDHSLIDRLKPNFIYLTHLHWDHFHGPSLRRFHSDTTIVVPKVVTRRMVEDLHWLGFKNVVEIPHGGKLKLNDDFYLHSYQFGLGVDSCVVLTGGDTTLFNVNDCKTFGLPLKALLKKFPHPDFIFRSHSSASAVPYCIEDHERLFPALRTKSDYEEEFSRFALFCGARYAIPFASNHCFLHRETRQFNSLAVTPLAAAAKCNHLASEFGLKTRAVVMPPGSAWDQDAGFSLTAFDYGDRAAYVEMLLNKYRRSLDKQYALEAASVGDFGAFNHYFQGLIAAIPRWLASRFLRPTTFRVREGENFRHWTVNFATGEIFESEQPPPQTGVVVTVDANILNDCCAKKMFSVWTASKRLSIRLTTAGDLRSLRTLFSVLDAFELGLLPIRNNFTLRALGVYVRRWRDAVEAIQLATNILIFRRRFSYRNSYPIGQAPSIS